MQLGRLDGIHRNLLLSNYYPIASHQVIVLSTDEEIDETRYEELKPFISKAYSLVFDEDSGRSLITDGFGKWTEEYALLEASA